MKFDPQELIDAYQGRAGLLARCILYGLVEPDVEVNPDILITLANTLADELSDEEIIESENRFLRQSGKALCWAIRDSIPAEIGILFYLRLMSIPVPFKDELRSLPEHAAFFVKYGDIIGSATEHYIHT